MAISTRMSRNPVTPSAQSPSIGARPSRLRPSSVKNSMAASMSSTTMPTLSIRLTVMMSPWRLTKSSAALLRGVRCSALFDFLDCCLHSLDESLELAVPIHLGSSRSPVYGTVLERIPRLPRVEVHVHMRNRVAMYFVVDLDRASHLLERQRRHLDVAHERGRVFVRKVIDLNHVRLQDEAAIAFETRIAVRYEARHTQIGNRAFGGRPSLRSLIADETTLS